ncbi:5-formyltetrahydrofolate cyclo-ligase [Gammaproteobacteria bacterium]|nr:5-formyltetrahydrofolate cyclo-ligase [Gammaproteobacteria bacterium]MDB9700398.1 5-formyltetrahydrofolate cyclo-ligase [Gammaproteobacteria bacterium]
MKKKYRESALKQRKALSGKDHAAFSMSIQRSFLQSFPLDNINNLGLYMPSNNEVSLSLVLREAERLNNLTLPIVKPKNELQLVRPQKACVYSKNQYNILEPAEGDEVKLSEHELIIVPSLAVDQDGYRLGYGGGYYDRFFATQSGLTQRPLIIGFLFDCQRVSSVFGEEHDIKFDYIFTEQGKEKF